MAVAPRNLTPFMQWFRNLLLGRKLKSALRFQDSVATRSPAPPNLPEGPSHKLAGNYYFTRDGRRCARPPMILIEETQKKALPAGDKEKTASTAVSVKKLGHIIPGNGYVWQEAPKQMSK